MANATTPVIQINEGQVGIGTTSPVVKLQVNGTNASIGVIGTPKGDWYTTAYNGIQVADGTTLWGRAGDSHFSGNYYVKNNSGSAQDTYINALSAHDLWLDNSSGSLKYRNAGLGVAGNAITFNTRFVVLNNGNFGIGTTSPKTSLDIVKDSDIWHLMVGGATKKLLVGGQAASGDVVLQAGAASTVNNAAVTTPYNLCLQRDGGNAGIGTSSPDFKLDVDGTFGVSDLPFNTGSVSVLVADETIGAELITNGDFATATDWTLQNAGSTISGGKLNQVSVPNGQNVYQTTGIVVGNTYKVVMTISGYSSGGVRALLGSTGATATRSANGTFLVEGIAAGNTTFYIQAIGTTTLSIDNVSVKQVISASNQIQKSELNNIPRTNPAASLYDLIPNGAFTTTYAFTSTAGTYAEVMSGDDVITETGTYSVQMLVNDFAVGGTQYDVKYSGVMTWHAGTVNDDGQGAESEIVLHRTGHASNSGITYLRTRETTNAANPGPNQLKLEIMGNKTYTAASNVIFKFVRLI